MLQNGIKCRDLLNCTINSVYSKTDTTVFSVFIVINSISEHYSIQRLPYILCSCMFHFNIFQLSDLSPLVALSLPRHNLSFGLIAALL